MAFILNNAVSMLDPLLRYIKLGQEPYAAALSNESPKVQTDIENAIALANLHGIGPLLYQSLRTCKGECGLQQQIDALASRAKINTLRNLLLLQELTTIHQEFSEKDILCIPFKGVVLGKMLYGNIGLREAGDIDIIVPSQRIDEARESIIAQGYTPFQTFEIPAQKTIHRLLGNHDEFYHSVKKIRLELHWDITDHLIYSRYKMATIWPRVADVQVGNQIYPMFSPNDLLMVLCLHGTKHEWSRLKWLYDIHQLVTIYQTLDWGWITDEAERNGIRRRVYLGLNLAHTLFGTKLPKSLLTQFQNDRSLEQLTNYILMSIDSSSPSNLFTKYTRRFQVYERWSDKAGYFFSLLASPLYVLGVEGRLPHTISQLTSKLIP